MPSFPDVRAEVADQLTKKSAIGEGLHSKSPESTSRRYPRTDTDRARFHRDVQDWYLARQFPRGDGRAIVTAGPPGAGKSTLLRALVPDLDEYRTIDSDIIKDRIIERSLADGIYAHLLDDAPLADGHRLAPRELSALVHDESVILADQIRRLCAIRQENVVIEGTLFWDRQGPTIFRELAENDYTEVRVYCVDVEREVAHQQALDRWWAKRVEWTRGQDPLGGRFVSADAIDIHYPMNGMESICTAHARGFSNMANRSGDIPNVRVTIVRPTDGGYEPIYDCTYPP